MISSSLLLEVKPDLFCIELTYNRSFFALCIVRLDPLVAPLRRSSLSALSVDELNHFSTFTDDRRAYQYAIGRLLVRHSIASMTGIDPSLVDIYQDSCYSKPRSSLASFNISHSKDIVICVFGLDLDFGVDVEHLDQTIDFIEVAKLYFPPDIRDYIISSPFHRRPHAFLEAWTYLEATSKLHGQGLCTPLREYPSSLCYRITFDSLPYLGCLAIDSKDPFSNSG
jgi:phosphopantetheinyl transferase